jgi:hypothetical protein
MKFRLISFRICFVIASTFILMIASPQTSEAENVVITIHLVNGKNGKPIKDENLNVFVNKGRGAENFRPDSDGIIKLTVDSNALVSFLSNIDVTCHKITEVENSQHQLQQYKVSDILEHGISDTNTCSKKVRIEPHPGDFIYYERPRTLWEWWAL